MRGNLVELSKNRYIILLGLLLLDEATSALDSASEHEVNRRMEVEEQKIYNLDIFCLDTFESKGNFKSGVGGWGRSIWV